uniref:STAT transcription factor all-alpha domain-containing protein n=1 Tax=Plectus sambesii TaxID=2011161 RepID=A0A914WTT5_9BILA
MYHLIQECRSLFSENNGIQEKLMAEWTSWRAINAELQQIQAEQRIKADSAHRDQELAQLEQKMELIGEHIHAIGAQLTAKRKELVEKILESMHHMLQNELIVAYSHLESWKIKQKTAQIGAPFNEEEVEFDSIHKRFSALFGCISELRILANHIIEK